MSKELALLIYSVGTCSPFNFASFVLAHLVRHARSCSATLRIGFPSLITGIILQQYPDILRASDTIGERGGPLLLSEKLFKGKSMKETTHNPQTSFNAPPHNSLIIQELETELTILDHTIEVLAGRRLVLDNLLAKLKDASQAGPSGTCTRGCPAKGG